MWLVVSVPVRQGIVTGVCKQKMQRRRFDVAVAKEDVGFILVADMSALGAAHKISYS